MAYNKDIFYPKDQFILDLENNQKINLFNKIDLSSKRWTIDDIYDFRVIEKVVNHFNKDLKFSLPCAIFSLS